MLSDPARSRQLRELVHSGISTFTSLESPADYPAAVCGFKAAIADLLWRMAASGAADDGVSARLYSAARTLQVFRRARDYIHHHLGDGISIPILCKQTGVSRRSLECVFRSVVGIGPGNYVRLLQLNLIRRDLLSGASDDVSIGVVAARHGVWHWSRFSRYYRSLFGELPSQTRQRRVGCANNSAMGFAASGTARV